MKPLNLRAQSNWPSSHITAYAPILAADKGTDRVSGAVGGRISLFCQGLQINQANGVGGGGGGGVVRRVGHVNFVVSQSAAFLCCVNSVAFPDNNSRQKQPTQHLTEID